MAPPSRILIVTSGPLWRNPRVLKEATALGRAGFDVEVLAPAYFDRHEAIDRDLLRGAPFRKTTIDLRAKAVAPRLRALASRLSTRIARSLVRTGIQSARALGPASALARRAGRIPFDLAIAHTEAAFAAAPRLLTRGRRVAADFEDWHSRDLLPSARRTRPLRLIAELERRLLREAAYTSATSEAMADALASAAAARAGPGAARRPIVIRNVFPLAPPPPPRPPDAPPAFFWFSQTLGAGRMIELFLAAWIETREPSRLCLLGEAEPDYRRKLERRVPRERRGRLEFLDVVPPAALPGVIARHDIGLALEPRFPENKDLTISNKLFQYFNAGLAVLATPTAGQREAFAAAPGAGLMLALTETQSAARLIDGLIRDPAAYRAMGAAGRRAAESALCWEKESPRLIEAVRSALETA